MGALVGCLRVTLVACLCGERFTCCLRYEGCVGLFMLVGFPFGFVVCGWFYGLVVLV